MSRSSAQIPVIDISPSNPHAATQLLDAAANNGFVFVENNAAAGMPPTKVQTMFNLVKNNLVHEAFNLGEFDCNKPNQPLPEPFSTKVNTVADFSHSCHALCNKLLQLFAEALEMPSDWFSSRHDQTKGPSGSIMRLLYYPSVPDTLAPDEDDIRAGAHSDYGTLTLLFQLPGQPGLEIKTPSGEWESVPVDPHGTLLSDPSKPLPILVNIGDLLAYWTNGLLKSTVHRVIFPKDARRGGEDRYSMAYFCHPLDDAELVPVPSKRVEQYEDGIEGVKKGGKTLTAKDHLLERLAATYGTKA
ncbi:iron/ascorbate family oxidoreductase [Aureobasidium sp. EXF-12298]|nr:iron/ascorbate family oxidoreductase [Aureobasidium sp. EXF-12298]KAI4754461.1 iron/ascorbate family oxidoreductase [Aureobasidium sp. EXF-12344]KAI4771612.1 iron/ascorbate family oxidoreductase [Aureobasidium sp. EXF-3400]